MAEAKGFLSLNPTVGDDADECRHEKRYDTLNGIEPGDVLPEADTAEICAE